MELIKNFGKRLQEIRIANKLTQAQLAEKAGLETATISKIETGYHYPKPENLEKFSQILGVSVKDFYDFGDCKTKEKLVKRLCQIINNSEIDDLIFYEKVINSHLEYISHNKNRVGKSIDG